MASASSRSAPGARDAAHPTARAQHGQRRAQFVRRVVGEAALTRQHGLDAREQAVHGPDQRAQLAGRMVAPAAAAHRRCAHAARRSARCSGATARRNREGHHQQQQRQRRQPGQRRPSVTSSASSSRSGLLAGGDQPVAVEGPQVVDAPGLAGDGEVDEAGRLRPGRAGSRLRGRPAAGGRRAPRRRSPDRARRPSPLAALAGDRQRRAALGGGQRRASPGTCRARRISSVSNSSSTSWRAKRIDTRPGQQPHQRRAHQQVEQQPLLMLAMRGSDSGLALRRAQRITHAAHGADQLCGRACGAGGARAPRACCFQRFAPVVESRQLRLRGCAPGAPSAPRAASARAPSAPPAGRSSARCGRPVS